MNAKLVQLVLIAVFTPCGVAYADMFGSGALAFEIDFVDVGAPGNVNNVHPRSGFPGIGAVDAPYRIARYEMPEKAVENASALGGLGIDVYARGPNFPATGVTWFEIARLVNWLNEDAGYPPAYKFDSLGEFSLWESGEFGFDASNPTRNSRAFYFLPTVDQWYKAAAYDPLLDRYYRYATGSDAKPTPVASGTDPGTAIIEQGEPASVFQAGGPSPFGTTGQTGNVIEWVESPTALNNDLGQSFHSYFASNLGSGDIDVALTGSSDPLDRSVSVGFRVASRAVPEPTAFACLISAIVVTALGRGSLPAPRRATRQSAGHRECGSPWCDTGQDRDRRR